MSYALVVRNEAKHSRRRPGDSILRNEAMEGGRMYECSIIRSYA